jgi:hypothetical protein
MITTIFEATYVPVGTANIVNKYAELLATAVDSEIAEELVSMLNDEKIDEDDKELLEIASKNDIDIDDFRAMIDAKHELKREKMDFDDIEKLLDVYHQVKTELPNTIEKVYELISDVESELIGHDQILGTLKNIVNELQEGVTV